MRWPAGRLNSFRTAPRACRKERNTLHTQKRFTASFGKWRPEKNMIAAPASGKSGGSQRGERKEPGELIGAPRRRNTMERRLPFEEIHFVGENGFAVAEEGDDDAKADGGFRGGIGADEEGEDLSGDVAVVT